MSAASRRKPPSIYEIIKLLRLPDPYCKFNSKGEYKFHKRRKWRFDYAWPEYKIAIEYEGIVTEKPDINLVIALAKTQKYGAIKSILERNTRHTSLTGYTKDCEKYTYANFLGWKLIRITAIMLSNGEAFDLIEKAFIYPEKFKE